MAVFKEYNNMGKDRSAEDRRRHRELVEESIKKNIGSIIAEESIIGQSKDKKIKIPIKSIKEFRFIYGKNVPGLGTGDGSEKKGDRIGSAKNNDGSKGQGSAGNQEGEDIYETEITIDELIQYLFEDIELPDLDRKKIADMKSITRYKYLGYKRKGIPPRLAEKRTAVERIKRRQGYTRDRCEAECERTIDAFTFEDENQGNMQSTLENGRFPFIEDDLRYRRVREERKKEFNAVIICIMDVSGSMDQTKKYIARSFYFLLYQFIRMKYDNVNVVFIAHTTVGKEVNENDFFHRGESGGTYISSGYEKALEIIEQRYSPSSWNIYAFHCSDGDNWTEDNEKAVELAEKLCDVCNLFGYGEIIPGYYSPISTIKNEFHRNIKRENFSVVTISKKEDILPSLKKILEKEKVY